MDVKPLIKNGLPVFVVVGAKGRIELNTLDIELELTKAKKAKKIKVQELISYIETKLESKAFTDCGDLVKF